MRNIGIGLFFSILVFGISFTGYANLRYDPNQLKQFESTNKCPNCDLTEIYIPFEKHDNAILTNALLTKSTLGTSFANSDFSHANMVDTYASNTMFSGSNFTDANLEHSSLSHSNCSRVNFTGANLSDVDFSYANLIQATVTSEQLSTVKSLSCAIMPNGTQHAPDPGRTC